MRQVEYLPRINELERLINNSTDFIWKVKKYRSSLKVIGVALVIALSTFGVWKSFTSPRFATFLAELREVLAQTNLPLFCLGIGLYLFGVLLAALNWRAILKVFGIAVPVIQLIPILMAGVFISNATPTSRVGGEIFRVYGLREKFKLPYTIAILSVALGRLMEVVPISLMGVIGISVIVQSRIISWQQFSFIGAMGCFAFGVAAWGDIYGKRCILTLWPRFLDYVLRKEPQFSGNQITIEEINSLIKHKKAFGESLLFASAFWMLALVRLKVLAYTLDIDLSFSVAAAATVWYVTMGFLSLTPGGIGIIEGGLVAGFVVMGVPPSQAFALTVLERAISYLFSTVIGAASLLMLGGRHLNP